MLRYFFGWFILLILAVANGGLRDVLYKDCLGDLSAHQVSTLTAIVLFGIAIYAMTRRWKIATAAQAWRIGLMWLLITVCFEFGFFHFVGGRPWSELFHAYNVFAGQVWIFLLLWVLIAPYVFFRFGSRLASRSDSDISTTT